MMSKKFLTQHFEQFSNEDNFINLVETRQKRLQEKKSDTTEILLFATLFRYHTPQQIEEDEDISALKDCKSIITMMVNAAGFMFFTGTVNSKQNSLARHVDQPIRKFIQTNSLSSKQPCKVWLFPFPFPSPKSVVKETKFQRSIDLTTTFYPQLLKRWLMFTLVENVEADFDCESFMNYMYKRPSLEVPFRYQEDHKLIVQPTMLKPNDPVTFFSDRFEYTHFSIYLGHNLHLSKCGRSNSAVLITTTEQLQKLYSRNMRLVRWKKTRKEEQQQFHNRICIWCKS